MNINSQNNLTFTSRNATIRFADNIARKVNNEYPRISASKFECLKNSIYYEDFLISLWDDINILRDNMEKHTNRTTLKKNKIKDILFLIKNQKLGNCSESSFLSFIAAKVNGLVNCKLAYLTSPRGYDYDHSILLIDDKKPYIIDSWLGFADYVPNAIKRYQKEFNIFFDFRQAKTQEMIVKEDYENFLTFLNENFSRKDIRDLKKIVPNLILKKD